MAFSTPLADKVTCLPISNHHWLQGSGYQVFFCLMARSECLVGRGQAKWRWGPYTPGTMWSWTRSGMTCLGGESFLVPFQAQALPICSCPNSSREASGASTNATNLGSFQHHFLAPHHADKKGSLWGVSHSISPGNAFDPWFKKNSKPWGLPLHPKSAKYNTAFLTNIYFATLLSLGLYTHVLNVIGFWVFVLKYAPAADITPWGTIVPYYNIETRSSLFICCGSSILRA